MSDDEKKPGTPDSVEADAPELGQPTVWFKPAEASSDDETDET